MKSACDCPKCRALCSNEPGWFVPEEIAPAAKFLNLSEAAFIATYLAEHPVEHGIALAPKQRPNKACIFLEKGLCHIHEVKPYECRKVFGCESERRHKRMRELIALRWK